MVRLLTLALSGLISLGCATTARTQPIVVGPVRGLGSTNLLDAAIAATQSLGYVVHEVDPVRGEYRIGARESRPGEAVWLIVQMYSDGWVRVIPAGPGARRDATHIYLPAAVAREHEAHAVALTAALTGAPLEESQ